MYRAFWPAIAARPGSPATDLCRWSGRPRRKRRSPMPRLVSHPDEVKIVSRRFGLGAAKIDRYLELGGYKAAKKCLEQVPDWIINEMKASNLRAGIAITRGEAR